MKSRIVVAVAVVSLGLAVGGCKGQAGEGLPPPSGSNAPAAPVIPKLADVAPPEASAAAEDQKAAWTGTLYARKEAQLGPKMTGILSQITVEEGDRVKKGQLLFRLDAAQAALAVSQAKAAIASAQVGYDAAKVELGRATELSQKGAIAPASFDQAKAAFDRASTGLDQAKVALQVAERSLADTSISSPIDGVVTAKLKNVGETVTMMPPTTVLVVQDVEKLELRARLPEKAAAQLDKASVLHMTIPVTGASRDVPVKRVNPTIDPRTRTIEVVADVDNKDGKFKVGMLAEVGLQGVAANGAAPPDGKLAGATEKAP
ncbi:MAG TPA: efflux RND transporter periplasmic adaptor subunit [Polyangiaceae bacterium]|nr:efflux RND transporter periplasmic adaptor subunit [Polyangiaceae bacterium]